MSNIDYNGELNCAISVRNLDAAIDWYQRVLGFKVRARMDQIHFAIIETSVPGVVLGLGEGEAPGSAGVALTWGVKDIEAAEASFKAAGGRPRRQQAPVLGAAEGLSGPASMVLVAAGAGRGFGSRPAVTCLGITDRASAKRRDR
jgi:catechol 2,3-dioxygenase-like lactoylglutathione lyase family enzyme